MELGQLAAEHFEGLLGGRLAIDTGSGTVDCEVIEVRRLPGHRLRAAPFALILRGPLDRGLAQGVYGLLHPELGRLDLLMVPVARSDAGYSYEITFN